MVFRAPKSACTFGRRKSKEAEMSFLASEETNGADFALTMSPDKSNFSKSAPPHAVRKISSPDRAKLIQYHRTMNAGENVKKPRKPKIQPNEVVVFWRGGATKRR